MGSERAPPRTARLESQRRTRARILRAAEELLAAQGGRGGIEQIARAAGFTRGAFYKNYDGRFELLLDILRARETAEILFWTTLFEGSGDLERTLAIVIEQSRELAKSRALVSLELQLEAERNPRFRPHHAAYLGAIYGEIGALIVALLKRHGKRAPPDLEEQVAGLYAFSLTFGLGTLSTTREDWASVASRLGQRQLEAIIAAAPPADVPSPEIADAGATEASRA